MCEYVSVVATTEGPFEIFAAPGLDSHGKAREGWGITGGAEVEWTREQEDYLVVRHEDPAIARMVKGMILERFKTRQGLIDSITVAKDVNCTQYLKSGVLHRVDGPALEYEDGSKEYWLNGERPRVDGPAVEDKDGSKYWYLNGNLPRVDGPALEDKDGYKYWYLNGNLPRVGGPALEYEDGYKAWYLNGKLHRVDGPALEYANGYKEYWLNGVRQPDPK